MRWLRSTLALVLGTGVLSLALVLHAAQPAQAFVAAPVIPIATSVLGGTATTTAGATAGVATLGTLFGVAALSAAVFTGSFLGTTALLNWAFDAPDVTGEPPADGSHAPYTRIVGGCGVHATAFATGFAMTSGVACPSWDSSTNGEEFTMRESVQTPSWTLAGGASSLSNVALVEWYYADGSVAGGSPVSANTAHGTLLATSATNTCHATDFGGAYEYMCHVSGYRLYVDPSKITFASIPLHMWRTDTTCKNTSSGATVTTTSYSAQFSENVNTALQAPVPTTPCASAWTPQQVKIYLGGPDGSGGTLVYTWNASTDSLLPPAEQTSPYKACYPGGSASPCLITLSKPDATGVLHECGESVNCTSFDPATSTTGQYTCKWGTYQVPLADCEGLKDWAQTQTQTGTEPAPAQAPGFPATGSNAAPVSGDTSWQECMGSAWSWNPVNWVYYPVKCSLTWAFVPRLSVLQAETAATKTTLNDTAPGKWVGAVDTLRADLHHGESGCLGPHVVWNRLPGGGMYPFSACESPMAGVAQVCHLIATVMVTFFGGIACLRALGSGLGWNPGVGKSE